MVYWLTKKSYTILYTTAFNIGLPGVQTLGIQTLLHQCPSRGKVAPGLLPFRLLTTAYDLALPPSHTGKHEKSLPYQTLTINLANLTQLLTTHRLCHFRASSCQLQVRHFSSLFLIWRLWYQWKPRSCSTEDCWNSNPLSTQVVTVWFFRRFLRITKGCSSTFRRYIPSVTFNYHMRTRLNPRRFWTRMKLFFLWFERSLS